jgi:hypothetical protein
MSRALRSEDPRPRVKLALGVGAVTVMAMVAARDLLRDAYLEPFIEPADVSLENRWCVLILFTGMILGGAALWIFMLRRYVYGHRSKLKIHERLRVVGREDHQDDDQ